MKTSFDRERSRHNLSVNATRVPTAGEQSKNEI
jgi:hypothetical protein